MLHSAAHSAAQCSSTLSDTFHESRLCPNNDPTLILEKKMNSATQCPSVLFNAFQCFEDAFKSKKESA